MANEIIDSFGVWKNGMENKKCGQFCSYTSFKAGWEAALLKSKESAKLEAPLEETARPTKQSTPCCDTPNILPYGLNEVMCYNCNTVVKK